MTVLDSLNAHVAANRSSRPVHNTIPAPAGSGAVAVAAGREAGRMLGDFKRTVRAPRPAAPVAAVATAPATRPWKTYADIDALVAQLPVDAKYGRAHFALPRTSPDGGGNMVTLFKVFTTAKGRRIVRLVADGTFNYAEHTLKADHQYAAALHILEDVMAARQLYGRSTGTCGDCGRPLSNEESIAYGVGPKCRTKK